MITFKQWLESVHRNLTGYDFLRFDIYINPKPHELEKVLQLDRNYNTKYGINQAKVRALMDTQNKNIYIWPNFVAPHHNVALQLGVDLQKCVRFYIDQSGEIETSYNDVSTKEAVNILERNPKFQDMMQVAV